MATEMTAAAAPKAPSLQERLATIESLITEAHVRVSTMAPPDDGKQPSEANDRAFPTTDRCVERLNELVQRLAELAERVGYI